MTDLTQAQSLYDRFGERFAANDFAAVEALWDAADRPFYIAEEIAEPITSWEGLRAYWEQTKRINSRAKLHWRVLDTKPLADGVLLALVKLEWMIHVTGLPRPYGGENRGFGVLRRVDGEWRFTAHIEAPPAPITWMKAIYEKLGAELDR